MWLQTVFRDCTNTSHNKTAKDVTRTAANCSVGFMCLIWTYMSIVGHLFIRAPTTAWHLRVNIQHCRGLPPTCNWPIYIHHSFSAGLCLTSLRCTVAFRKGPTAFIVCSEEVADVFLQHGVNFHLYATDLQGVPVWSRWWCQYCRQYTSTQHSWH